MQEQVARAQDADFGFGAIQIDWLETGFIEVSADINTAEFTLVDARPSARQGQDYSDTAIELILRLNTKDHKERAHHLYSLLSRYLGQRFPIVMHSEAVDPHYLYTVYTYSWRPELENDYQDPDTIVALSGALGRSLVTKEDRVE